jgi:hypothetical protein
METFTDTTSNNQNCFGYFDQSKVRKISIEIVFVIEACTECMARDISMHVSISNVLSCKSRCRAVLWELKTYFDPPDKYTDELFPQMLMLVLKGEIPSILIKSIFQLAFATSLQATSRRKRLKIAI